MQLCTMRDTRLNVKAFQSARFLRFDGDTQEGLGGDP